MYQRFMYVYNYTYKIVTSIIVIYYTVYTILHIVYISITASFVSFDGSIIDNTAQFL